MGELASSRIVATAFADKGIPAVWVDARRVLVTDDEHTAALPDMDATCARTSELVAPRRAAGQVAVLGGFIGATANGVTTTLGPRRIGLLGGDLRRVPGRGRNPDLDRRRRHAHRGPPRRVVAAPGPAAVVRRSVGARLLRRESSPPEHDSSGSLQEHSRTHSEFAPARGRRHDDHGRRPRRQRAR